MLIIICEFCYSEVTLEGQNERKKGDLNEKPKRNAPKIITLSMYQIFLKSIPLFEPHLSANTIQSK